MARAGASKFAALDAWQRDNRDALTAACKASRVRYSDTVGILRLLTQRAKPDGQVSESVAQLSEATGVGDAQVRRALDALTGIGVLQTLKQGRSGGAGGGKGRPSVRRLSFLTVIEAATGNADGLGITQNERALNQEWARTTEGMSAHSGALPHGNTTTEPPTTPARDADAERAAGNRGGVLHTKQGQTHDAWKRTVEAAVAKRLLDTQGGRIRDPEAWKRTVASTTVRPLVQELQTHYARLHELTPRDDAWHELITVLACQADGKGEAPSDQAWDALRPYRLALAAGDG